MSLNKKYKDTVFVKLFSDEEKVLNLYNAIKGTEYSLEKNEVKIITLEDVLYMERKNDLCFTIDNKFVVLVEHQSTINNNMPLRFLFYITREYEKIIKDDVVYKSKLIKIPTPEFIVLYNGEQNYPERKKLRLSESFYSNENINLELIVDVLNINYEKNKKLIKKSSVLEEYSYFIYLVRKYREEYRGKVNEKELLEKAIEKAIKECIKKGVLKEFLKEHSSEVINMLYAEFDIEKAREVWQQEALEDGIKIGLERGIEKGIEKGLMMSVKSLVNNNLPFELVSKYLNIPITEVEEYAKMSE